MENPSIPSPLVVASTGFLLIFAFVSEYGLALGNTPRCPACFCTPEP